MDGTSDAALEAKLFEWAEQHGTKINHPFVMADFALAGGRGAAACSDIPKDAEVMEMPTSLFFGLTPLGGHPVIGDVETLGVVLSLLKAKDPETHMATTWQMQLALLVLIEKHKHGEASDCWPFIKSLPTTEPSLREWASDEFGGSALDAIQLPRISNWLRGKRALVQSVWEACVASPEMAARGFDCFGGRQLPLDEMLWALRCVSSRSYQIIDARPDASTGVSALPTTAAGAKVAEEEEPEGRPTSGMFPVLDLFNHSDAANILVSFRPSRGVFVVEALRDIRAGEQLVREYGPAPNSFYFITYGFVPAANLHNTLMVDLRDEMERLEAACKHEYEGVRPAGAADASVPPAGAVDVSAADDASAAATAAADGSAAAGAAAGSAAAGKEAAHAPSREMRQLTLLRRAGIFRGPNYLNFARRRDQTAQRGWVEAGPKLVICATLLCMDTQQLQDKALVMAALMGRGVSEKVDAAASALAMAKLVAARDAMPTTLEQDVKQLRMCTYKGVGGAIVPRLRMHIAEKRMIRTTMHALEQRAVKRLSSQAVPPPPIEAN